MPKLIPEETKQRALALRQDGASINHIARATGMAKSTVSLLVRDVALSDEQREHLRSLRPRQRGHLARSRICRAQSHSAQLAGRALAELRDAHYVAGVMLYWAEEDKSRNRAGISNCDPQLLRMWLDWVEEFHGPREEATLAVHCFLNNGLFLPEIEDWWLEQLGLPRTSLRKSSVNNASSASKGVRKKQLYGTAHLRVHSTFLVQSIYGAIQEIGGFERLEWLDLQGAMPAPTAVS